MENIPPSNIKYKISNYLDTWYHYEGCSNLDNLLENVGPVIVAFDVYHGFFSYSSGVYSCATETQYAGGHAMVAIGYTPSYYIVQNSWGTGWGINGNLHLTRSAANNCYMCYYNSYVPTI